MTRIRKAPYTSAEFEIDMIQAPQNELKPTRQLEPRAHQIFEMITSMRPAALWEAYDLQLATDLAETNAQIELAQEVLTVEGDVLIGRLGTPIINPRATHCGNLRRQAVTYMRALGLTAGQRRLGEEPMRKRSDKLQELEQIAKRAEKDQLLAQPEVGV
ncbi:TPA: hypothetical protein NL046_002693 [Pseudomonas aeruginosa]|uniref:hypothetical protein n=1 Tax=Pseudomonas aeruginosa TaxID=287 RepID=UPI00044B0EFC|nr:hypothetical protein [Pseudomonas aeruginosa]EJB8511216.1 hypothetical protein [Pseudomonas aeruginosa]EME5356934.1 hypothetical protein [Pseudomonas aeruginosa]EZP05718.1 hypothetical protein V555_01860 [Pseudomonas aeruginosa BWH054]MBG7306555.1 hypothetical protein [Pseudomonas aeruginosa]MBH3521944.1 hypothetical protein [Pseudomonas aeruginosa]